MSKREHTPLIVNRSNMEETKIHCRHFLLLPIIVIMFPGYSIQMYVVTQWIQHFWKTEENIDNLNSTSGCLLNNESDPRYESYKIVEQKTALWQLYYTLCCAVPAFFATAILPSYSDTFGRRFLFVICFSTMLLKSIACTLIVYYKCGLVWLLVGSVVEGVTGSYYTSTSACLSYIADVTSPGRERTLAITIFDGVGLITTTMGGLASGYLIGYLGFFNSLLLSLIMMFCAWFLVIAFLPETLERKNNSHTTSLISNVRRITDFYNSNSVTGKRTAYILLILTMFLSQMAGGNRASIEIIYQLGKPFCWSAEQIGLYSAARHATQGIAGIVLISPLKKCFSEISIAIWSNVLNSGSFVLEAMARTYLMLYLVPVAATFGRLSTSMTKSLMSSMTPADKQGSLFSSINAVQNLCGIAAPFLNNAVYASTVSLFNGFVFLILAGFCVLAFILLLIFVKTQTVKTDTPSYEPITNQE